MLLLLLAGFGLARLRPMHKPIDWFPADNPAHIASERIDRDLRGASTAEVLIDTSRENGLQDPGSLKAIETATREVEMVRARRSSLPRWYLPPASVSWEASAH